MLAADGDRVEPPRHPGLDLGHVAYARQLVWKREVLEDALRRGGLEAPATQDGGGPDVVPSPATWGYRNAIQPAVGAVDERAPVDGHPVAVTELGYRRPGGRDVVALDDDPTANEACRRRLAGGPVHPPAARAWSRSPCAATTPARRWRR